MKTELVVTSFNIIHIFTMEDKVVKLQIYVHNVVRLARVEHQIYELICVL